MTVTNDCLGVSACWSSGRVGSAYRLSSAGGSHAATPNRAGVIGAGYDRDDGSGGTDGNVYNVGCARGPGGNEALDN